MYISILKRPWPHLWCAFLSLFREYACARVCKSGRMIEIGVYDLLFVRVAGRALTILSFIPTALHVLPVSFLVGIC